MRSATLSANLFEAHCGIAVSVESARQELWFNAFMARTEEAFGVPPEKSVRRPVGARLHEDVVEEMQGDRVLSRRQVADLLGISLPTLWRLVKRGDFPRPFRISPGRVGWRARIVLQWLADRSNGEERP